jgi:prepilin-type N-terminal cleavage/methylation domain-containing protein
MAQAKHNPRQQDTSRGFSLIEVMIALTFLAVGLLAVAQMIPFGLAGVTQARVRTNAVQAAQERLDTLKAADFDGASLTAGAYSEADGKYTLDWTIADNTPIPKVKRIDLVASWPNASGTQSVTLTTYVSKH